MNFVSIAIIFFSFLGYAQDPVQKKILEQKKRLENLKKQEDSLYGELFQIQKRADKTSQEIAAIESQKIELERKLSQNNHRFQNIQSALRELDREVFAHIRNFSMRRRPGALQAFISSDSLPEFQYKQFLVRQWLQREGAILENYRHQTSDLSQSQASLEENQKALAVLVKQLDKKKADYASEQQDKKRLLSLVKDQKGFYIKNIDELEKASRDIQKLILGMNTTAQSYSRFKQMQGKLSLPVRGVVEKEYGPYIDPKLKTKVYHKGLDLKAPKGALVRAVFDGKIAYADWFAGYGNIVIVDHDGEYFTLYAHLLEVLKNVGDDVVVGESIAKVGDSASVKGPYLYFELRKKGISENPMPWFMKTRRTSP